VDTQWHALQTAPAGSMNSYLFRLAQFVLLRVDPDESFLKAVSSPAGDLVLSYPVSRCRWGLGLV